MTDTSSWLDKIKQLMLREPKDRAQLIDVLEEAAERNLLDEQSLKMILGVMQISSQQVRDIMVTRAEMVVVEKNQTPEEFLPIILESGHSRFPVIGESRDEIIGILLAKDLLTFQTTPNNENFDLQKILRSPIFVPESKRLDVLLREFRINHNHLAIVVDEYGGVAGLVTIEDVLEEIVGNIEDEYDVEEEFNIRKQDESHYLIKALTPIQEFNQLFNTDFSDSEVDTVGGLVTRSFGHLPKRGESINIGRFKFKILQAESRKIHLLRLTLRKNQ